MQRYFGWVVMCAAVVALVVVNTQQQTTPVATGPLPTPTPYCQYTVEGDASTGPISATNAISMTILIGRPVACPTPTG